MNMDIINIDNQDIFVYDFLCYLNEAISEWYNDNFDQETLEDFIKERFFYMFRCNCDFDGYDPLKETEDVIKQIIYFITLYKNEICSIEFHMYLLEDDDFFD